jgi:L-alanine-DL-glutamate epimerase-like enolase superfamily enzyme
VVYVSEAGGLTRARQIAAIADACGKWCNIGTWAESGVATMAGAHVIMSSTNFPFSNDTHYMLQDGDVVKEPLVIRNGSMNISRKPGLGVELDEKKLEEMSRMNVRESVFFDNIEDESMPRVGQIL